MEQKHTSYRRGPALATAAVLGLTTTALLAPGASAATTAEGTEDTAGTVTVVAEATAVTDGFVDETVISAPEAPVDEAPIDEVPGGEATGEAGDATAVTEETDEVSDKAADEAAAEEKTEDVLHWNEDELEVVCLETGLAGEGAEQGEPAAAIGTVATETGAADAAVTEATEGPEEATDLTVAVPAGAPSEGEATQDCEAAAGGAEDPGVKDEDGTTLPVGGVDAGVGETAGLTTGLSAGVAGAAAALGLGSYLLVRRSRSQA